MDTIETAGKQWRANHGILCSWGRCSWVQENDFIAQLNNSHQSDSRRPKSMGTWVTCAPWSDPMQPGVLVCVWHLCLCGTWGHVWSSFFFVLSTTKEEMSRPDLDPCVWGVILVTRHWSCNLGAPRLMLSALVDCYCAAGTASSSEPKRQTDSTKSSKSSRKKGRIQRARERGPNLVERGENPAFRTKDPHLIIIHMYSGIVVYMILLVFHVYIYT